MENYERFQAQFGEFVRRALDAEPEEEPRFRIVIREHLGIDPLGVPIVSLQVPTWDQANLQFALEGLLERNGVPARSSGSAAARSGSCR